MDLSFRFDRNVAVAAIPTELAVLLVGVAARQAASPTARLQSRLAGTTAIAGIFTPPHGAFNHAVEVALTQSLEP